MPRIALLLATIGFLAIGSAIAGVGLLAASGSPDASNASAQPQTKAAGSTQAQRGPRGFRGPRGPRGLRGLRGLRGAAGTAGPAGPAGTAGPAGATGAAGPAGAGLRVLLQASGPAAITDLLVVKGHKIQGGCTAGSPELRSQTNTDNAVIHALGDGAGAKFYTEDDDFDIGQTVTHTNATTNDSAIFNLAYVSFTGDVATTMLGVEASPVGFDCLIFGTATQAP